MGNVLTSTLSQVDGYTAAILIGLGLIIIAAASIAWRWRGVHRLLDDSQFDRAAARRKPAAPAQDQDSRRR